MPYCRAVIIPKIIIALDYSDKNDAMKLVKNIDPNLCRLKIGKGMFVRFGIKLVYELHKLGFDIFLDLKFHDIPKTVYSAIKAVSDIGIWMISVHASGGVNMLKSAKKALSDLKYDAPLLVAITVLTSLNKNDLKDIGIDTLSLSDYVLKLAILAKKNGLDGIVCPGKEAKNIKNILGKTFKIITPGIRSLGISHNDQLHCMTPEEAMMTNSIDYMVIGRSITSLNNPISTLNKIIQSIKKINEIKFNNK